MKITIPEEAMSELIKSHLIEDMNRDKKRAVSFCLFLLAFITIIMLSFILTLPRIREMGYGYLLKVANPIIYLACAAFVFVVIDTTRRKIKDINEAITKVKDAEIFKELATDKE